MQGGIEPAGSVSAPLRVTTADSKPVSEDSHPQGKLGSACTATSTRHNGQAQARTAEHMQEDTQLDAEL